MANPNPIPNLKPEYTQRGGAREGAGRPKGSKNINSKDSVKKLEELSFDPIEMMVKKYNMIEKNLASGEVRVGSGAWAQLLATQGVLINNLMAYGYKKIPDKVEQEVTKIKPVSVVLTTRKEEDAA